MTLRGCTGFNKRYLIELFYLNHYSTLRGLGRHGFGVIYYVVQCNFCDVIQKFMAGEDGVYSLC